MLGELFGDAEEVVRDNTSLGLEGGPVLGRAVVRLVLRVDGGLFSSSSRSCARLVHSPRRKGITLVQAGD